MNSLHEPTEAEKTKQAREKYERLVALARKENCPELVPKLRKDTNLRSIETATDVAIDWLSKYRPDLRKAVSKIFPGRV